MFNLRISPRILEHRLDSGFYNPKGLKATEMLEKNMMVLPLSALVDQSRTITNGVRGPDWENTKYKLIRLQDCESWQVNHRDAASISLLQFKENNRCKLKVNDIVVAIGGYVGNAAVLTEDCYAVIGQHSAILPSPEAQNIDSRFLLAYLNSRIAESIFNRYVSGTVQAGINLEDLRDLPAPVIDTTTQKYIGDKVRQAEELRAWAKNQKVKLKALESQIPAIKLDTSDSKVSLANLSFLTENRLDARYYSKKHLNLYSQFSSDFVSLGDICSGFKYGASIAANYVEQDGLPFIRGNALYANGINREDIVYLDKSMQKELKSAFVNEGDILVTRSGTVGVTTFVSSDYSKFWYGSFIIKCNLVSDKYIPEYISWFLNSWVGQQQFRRLENGAVQLNVNIEELSSIYVWSAPDQFQTLVKELIENEVSAINASKNLIFIAKTLVEALIEGQLTEEQLIQAQQALEDGDNTLDKAILSKLSSEGYAVEGATPLFSDVDELYHLLAASVNTAADSED